MPCNDLIKLNNYENVIQRRNTPDLPTRRLTDLIDWHNDDVPPGILARFNAQTYVPTRVLATRDAPIVRIGVNDVAQVNLNFFRLVF